jgi:G-protein alpha subunit
MSLARKIEGRNGLHTSYSLFIQEQHLDAIIFVVSLAAYDQMMYEDPLINRFMDSMVCFEELMNNSILKKVSVILMFNKYDLFLEKCKCTRFHTFIPHYIGTFHLK